MTVDTSISDAAFRLQASRMVGIAILFLLFAHLVLKYQVVRKRILAFLSEPDSALNLGIYRFFLFSTIIVSFFRDRLLAYAGIPEVARMPPRGAD